jgi:hypothetical protein
MARKARPAQKVEDLIERAAKLADERAAQDERDYGAAASGAADGLGDEIRKLLK